jgi:hypothetical protein
MIKTILPAAAFSLLISSGAWALPSVSSDHQISSSSSVVKVNDDGDDHGRHRKWHGDHAFRDDDHGWNDHYRDWHRYSYRPDHWDERGCISVGPVWYCS